MKSDSQSTCDQTVAKSDSGAGSLAWTIAANRKDGLSIRSRPATAGNSDEVDIEGIAILGEN